MSDPEGETEDLLRRAREGSREALGLLLGGCGARLLTLIRFRLGPRRHGRSMRTAGHDLGWSR